MTLAYFVVIVSTNRVDSTIASQLLMHKHLKEVSKGADTNPQPTQKKQASNSHKEWKSAEEKAD